MTTSRSRIEAFTLLRSIADAADRLREEIRNQRLRSGRRAELIDAHAELGRLLKTSPPEGTADDFGKWWEGLEQWCADHTPLPERFDDHEKPPLLSNLARRFGDAVDKMESDLSDDELAAPKLETEYVTLDQAAAWVGRSKRSLEYYKDKGLPEPDVRGRGGKPSEWRWSTIRGWLVDTFGRQLPEKLPPDRVVAR